MTATIGFSDHSGWAVMAIVSGTAEAPQFVERRRILLCPPELPRQAFHAVAEQGAPRSVVATVVRGASGLAAEAFEQAHQHSGGSLLAAGVAMGRTPVPADIEKILGSHALLHAAEGELYRDVLAEAAAKAGLRVVRFLNKEVRSEAAAALGWRLAALETWLTETGKVVGAPWTKDEKDATASALLALATISSQ